MSDWNELSSMNEVVVKILPNLLTVDSDRANFPLHGGIGLPCTIQRT